MERLFFGSWIAIVGEETMAESLAWKSDTSSAPSAMASICIECTGPIISLPKKVSVANFEYLFIYLAKKDQKNTKETKTRKLEGTISATKAFFLKRRNR
ncbi:hypothetical protein H5410_039758 [Solanum commersonii]|uniref:Uncharacterized protein n=1 Tax=Solanum commersonii TaxID=4109 RepID=A0A9J5XPF9_SOLCO|nr:hypothetical protein H5410_039758 [Solanum commersonii]